MRRKNKPVIPAFSNWKENSRGLRGLHGLLQVSDSRLFRTRVIGVIRGSLFAAVRASLVASVLLPWTTLAQDEVGPREIQIPNPMSAHTWFIIVAVGAFLAWCISYVLQLQKDRQNSQQTRRESLLRQKEELLDRIAELEARKDAGTITAQRYEKEFRKAKGRLSEIIGRLAHKQDAPET